MAPVILMDEEDSGREREGAIINYFERAFHILNAYQEGQKPKHHKMSLRAMELALGFHLAAGSDNAAELARKCGVTKAAANKCLNGFMSALALEPLPSQRKDKARQNMSVARRKQLGKGVR